MAGLGGMAATTGRKAGRAAGLALADLEAATFAIRRAGFLTFFTGGEDTLRAGAVLFLEFTFFATGTSLP